MLTTNEYLPPQGEDTVRRAQTHKKNCYEKNNRVSCLSVCACVSVCMCESVLV